MSDDEIAAIESQMADTQSEYYQDTVDSDGNTPMQNRYLELVEFRDGSGLPSAPRVSSSSEMRQIEKLMEDRHSRYWQGPDSQKLQARYLELLERGSRSAPRARRPQAAKVVADAPRANAPQADIEVIAAARAFWHSDRGQDIIKEWEQTGGVEENSQAAIDLADDLAETLPPQTRDEFVSHFGTLSVGLQMGVLAELSNPYISVPSASADAVNSFASGCTEGAELVAEWGDAAPRRVAAVRGRFKRLRGRLSGQDAGSLDGFLEATTPDEFKAVARYFAGDI